MTRGVKPTNQADRLFTMVDRGPNPSDPKNDKNFIILIFILGIRCKMVNLNTELPYFTKNIVSYKNACFRVKLPFLLKMNVKMPFYSKITFFHI